MIVVIPRGALVAALAALSAFAPVVAPRSASDAVAAAAIAASDLDATVSPRPQDRRHLLYEPPFTYLGCYQDVGYDRALPYYREHASDHAECARLCVSIGATHMGRQYQGECWCGGTDYDKHGTSTQCTDCTVPGNNYFGYANCVFSIDGTFANLPPVVDAFLGCHDDDRNGGGLWRYAGAPLSLEGCASACSNWGHTRFGRQYVQECWCGDHYGVNGPSTHCYDCVNSDVGYNIGGGVNCVFGIDDSSDDPTSAPTVGPTDEPTGDPTSVPTDGPTGVPTGDPTASPVDPSPTVLPTSSPTDVPSASPSDGPTSSPTSSPTSAPTVGPTDEPTGAPTSGPTDGPTGAPTGGPTAAPVAPSASPSDGPTGDGPYSSPIKAFEGCYADAAAVRDLPVLVPGSMTLQECAAACSSRGHPYMGRQWNAECWCGQTPGLHGPSSGCVSCETLPGTHNYGGSVNCVFSLDVTPEPCTLTTVKAIIVKPDTFLWWHSDWRDNVDGYVRWLADRIAALKNLGLVEGVSVAVRMNDDGEGGFFYTSSVPHTSPYDNSASKDPPYEERYFFDFLKRARELGLKTYAWIPAFYDPVQISSAGNGRASYKRDGTGPKGGLSPSPLFASPFSADARSHVYDVIQEVLTLPELLEVKPWDGVRLDYVRFDSHQYDFSDGARSQFQALGKKDPWELKQDMNDAEWVEWAQFRRETITLFLDEATTEARAAGGPGLDVGGYLLPFAAPGCMEDHDVLGYETYGWEQGNCYEDYAAFNFRLSPMAYWQDWTTNADFESWASAVAHGSANKGLSTPTVSITDCNYGGCDFGTRTNAQIVSTFRRFAEISVLAGSDGIEVFLFPDYEDSHLDNLAAALFVCTP